VTGNVEAKTLDLSGATKIAGNVKAGEFHAKGSCTVTGGVAAETFDVNGAASVGRSVKAGTFRATGAFSVGGGVDAKSFFASGGFGVEGDIKAERVEIEINGHAKARAISGTDIRVKLGPSSSSGGCSVAVCGAGVGVVVTTGEHILEADSISGDDIALEATRAKRVKGKRVKIGAGCEIERVEYTESIEMHEKATVTKQERVSR